MPDTNPVSAPRTIRFYHRWPIRFPGGLIWQYRTWYALGRDAYGTERCGAGATPAAARRSLAKCLAVMARYRDHREGRS